MKLVPKKQRITKAQGGAKAFVGRVRTSLGDVARQLPISYQELIQKARYNGWQDYVNWSIKNNDLRTARQLRGLHFLENAGPLLTMNYFDLPQAFLPVSGRFEKTKLYDGLAPRIFLKEDPTVSNNSVYANINLNNSSHKLQLSRLTWEDAVKRDGFTKAFNATPNALVVGYGWDNGEIAPGVVTTIPNLLKSTSIITKDVNGNIIPLDERDNFKKNDPNY